ncbi:MAG TPA: L,D-transpeptidase family protein, partial [Caulobacteraceae bacterium]
FEPVSATAVDWSAVADGTANVHVRQLPGPGNVMGQVKFMLPNLLGIYLHDTPERGLFHSRRRADSHGCVRLQHPEQLAAWLFGRPVIADGRPDQEVDLAASVPVYIVYLTLTTTPGGLSRAPDIYRRDAALSVELAARGMNPTKSLVDRHTVSAQADG